MSAETWSSRVAFYFVSIGAAVGLGTVWRFPYLAGQYGSAFIVIFILACVLIATPVLAAEFLLGRRGRGSPPAATRAVAVAAARSSSWSAIGWVGTIAITLIMAYYCVIGGWVLAYLGNFLVSDLEGRQPAEIAQQFAQLLENPRALAFWHFLFAGITAAISAAGLQRGIELANKIMLPGLFALLLGLVIYAGFLGDFERAAPLLMRAQWSAVDGNVVLLAVGQAFFATGVGQALMIAYGAYVPRNVSLLRSGAVISGSIIVASILTSLVVFPLAFRYDIDPGQGPQLVFIVLPTIFSQMPGGQLAGIAFFILLAFAALTSAVAGLEPPANVMQERLGWSRRASVIVAGVVIWFAGLAAVLSFNLWKHVRPLAGVPGFRERGIFETLDYVSANLLLPLGVLLTCLFVAWRLPGRQLTDELSLSGTRLLAYRLVLGLLCPLAIVAMFIANL